MKIGILTYHYVSNFGANLQALSTVSYLKKNGHSPKLIDWRPIDVEERYRKGTPAAQVAVHEAFAQRHYPMSTLCRTAEDIAAVIQSEAIDAVIIGSDAVVSIRPQRSQRYFSLRRMRYCTYRAESSVQVGNPFWGTFSRHLSAPVPLAMLSVSSQNARYDLLRDAERSELRQAVKEFAYVSVRDAWTRDMLRAISEGGIDAEITPDPVFAINSNIPEALSDRSVIKRFNLPEKYILVSFKQSRGVSDRWVAEFDALARTQGFECVALPYPQELNAFSLAHRIDLPLDPLEWYALIKHSAGYVGHNMHPVICAIHNCVPFYSFDTYGCLRGRMLPVFRSSKIRCLLNTLGFSAYTTNLASPVSVIPGPDLVFRRIREFDVPKCSAASRMMRSDFECTMGRLLNSLASEAMHSSSDNQK